jgi:hypothetical protein
MRCAQRCAQSCLPESNIARRSLQASLGFVLTECLVCRLISASHSRLPTLCGLLGHCHSSLSSICLMSWPRRPCPSSLASILRTWLTSSGHMHGKALHIVSYVCAPVCNLPTRLEMHSADYSIVRHRASLCKSGAVLQAHRAAQ